ncbi:MAG: PfkB family carbohydrate kinase [Ottowia sp.]|uniref:PfkB family carbohydrate kinase n=1 Tax=unclassified Ottowia TaxID=2645081 RepID=UPI003C2C3DB2
MRAVAPLEALIVGSYVQACCWHVDRLPRPGESVTAERYTQEMGGKGLNVAVGLARLRRQPEGVAALIGCGRDAAGDALLDLLKAEGLDAAHVSRLPGTSGMGSGLIGPDGENQIAVAPGANALLTAAHVDAAAASLAAARVVYGQFEAAQPAVERALSIAAGAGVLTVLNPSPWHRPSAALRQATRVLIVNRMEAAALWEDDAALRPESMPHALARLAQTWPNLTRLLVTLGPEGSLGFVRDAPGGGWRGWKADACAVQAMDGVGAGDAFSAACLDAWLAGCDMAQTLQRAQRCAAHVVEGVGVLARLPYRGQLESWLQDAGMPVVREMALG